jgi:putative membrane protein
MGGAQGQYGQGQYGSQGASGSTSGQSGAMGSTNTMGGTMDVSSFNDAQIAAVVHAVNAGEIQEAQLAESKASSAEVKRFARDMVNHHRAMQSSATSAFQKANLTPSENAVSQQLTSDTQNELSMLQGVNGRDFDRDYIDSQVKDHSMALDLIDKMLPNAKDPQLKTMLQDARTKVEAHLRDAQRIQGTLQKGTTNRQGQGGSSNPSSGSGTQQSPTSP